MPRRRVDRGTDDYDGDRRIDTAQCFRLEPKARLRALLGLLEQLFGAAHTRTAAHVHGAPCDGSAPIVLRVEVSDGGKDDDVNVKLARRLMRDGMDCRDLQTTRNDSRKRRAGDARTVITGRTSLQAIAGAERAYNRRRAFWCATDALALAALAGVVFEVVFVSVELVFRP